MDLARELLKVKIEMREIKEEMSKMQNQSRMPNYTKGLFTLEEVAEMAGCSLETIRRKVPEKLAVKFPGAKRCVTPEAVLNYLQGR